MASFELRSLSGKRSFRIDADYVRVGRSPDNTVVIPDPAVSRYHLNFYVKNGALVVEDAGSQNGFLVNGLPANGPTSLAVGDRLFFGNLEYTVTKPGAAAGASPSRSTAAGSTPAYAAASSMSAKAAPNKRIYVYLAVLAFLGLAIYRNNQQKPGVPAGNDVGLENPLASMNSESFRPEPRIPKSRTQITAEGYFKEGMREFENGNYVRAIKAFELTKTENPSMESIDEYLGEAQRRLKNQTENLLKNAERSFSRLQFKRAKAEASGILTVLAEQMDYTRKLAQESASAPKEGARPPTQEEILLQIPCDKTSDPNLCTKSLELIKKSRQLLGEEDAFR
jgi:hypothetical protein